ncbi:DUF4278 domain-containing protein [Synechococcus sp. RSCCF101]|uniref:DUF4278 domain-containing protein n=1 Tax=Synechococcus sp. RSCCF101 TaxID=2511069 RepID=UPI001245AF72|nr:DUF4278 domain-containing protein [Synechococcus sp. RSCCF101]QEY32039.1 DUF4278 domain-containing protein [Synechococcus sp. RSCCF101]
MAGAIPGKTLQMEDVLTRHFQEGVCSGAKNTVLSAQLTPNAPMSMLTYRGIPYARHSQGSINHISSFSPGLLTYRGVAYNPDIARAWSQGSPDEYTKTYRGVMYRQLSRDLPFRWLFSSRRLQYDAS